MNSTLIKTNVSSLKNLEHKWSNEWIDPHLVIKFPQVRKTFEEPLLQELADDIAKKGLIQPPMLAKLTFKSFSKYTDVFEKISKTKIIKKNYPSSLEAGQSYYYVLIAGERRYRAHMILWDSGCTECKDFAKNKMQNLKQGQCFLKHFPEGFMEARVGLDVEPEIAKSVQFRENNHVRPLVHEEAYAYRDYWDYMKILNPNLTLKDFASEVGVSADKVRTAIWFCELPEDLRILVEQKMVSYSNALELKRILALKDISEQLKLKLIEGETLYLLINPKVKHEDYKKRVTNLINDLNAPTLFDIQQCDLSKKKRREIVGKNLLNGMFLMENYAIKVQRLMSQGLIGRGNVFSGISPTYRLKNILEQVERIIPGFTLTVSQRNIISKINLDK